MPRKNNIKCPHCGWEYMPGEVYYPKYFLGQPLRVIKDETGAILSSDGDMELTETFTCDNCSKKFSVEATVSFKTIKYIDIFDEDEFDLEIEEMKKSR